MDEIVSDNDRVRQLDIAERPNEADKDDSLPAFENIYVPLTLSMVICLIQVFVILFNHGTRKHWHDYLVIRSVKYWQRQIKIME